MPTYEWIMLIGVLIGGFWTVSRLLAKIEVTLSGKVNYKDCEVKREHCPLHADFKKLDDRISKLHPPER